MRSGPHEWMSQERIDDNWYPDGAGGQPEREWRKLLPEWQILSVVYIERRQQEGLGKTHAGDVQPDPLGPVSPSSGVANHGRSERECSKDE